MGETTRSVTGGALRPPVTSRAKINHFASNKNQQKSNPNIRPKSPINFDNEDDYEENLFAHKKRTKVSNFNKPSASQGMTSSS